MNKRTIGIIMVVLGVAGIATALAWSAGDVRDIISLEEKIGALDSRIDTTRASLFDANALYRGYMESLKSIPDSIKSTQSFILMRKGDDYRKRVVSLERNESDFLRQKKRRKYQIDEARSRILSRGVPVAGAGLLLLIAGFVVRRNSLIR